MPTSPAPAAAPPASGPASWTPVVSRAVRAALLAGASGSVAGGLEGLFITLFASGTADLGTCLALVLDRALTLGVIGFLGGAALGLVLGAAGRLKWARPAP